MVFEVQDAAYRVTIRRLSNGKGRLTLDYPVSAYYSDKVYEALKDILKSSSEEPDGSSDSDSKP